MSLCTLLHVFLDSMTNIVHRASAVTFVGCIYQIILAFFVVMIAGGAREASGLERKLTTMSLIHVRMITSFVAYFILSVSTAQSRGSRVV